MKFHQKSTIVKSDIQQKLNFHVPFVKREQFHLWIEKLATVNILIYLLLKFY